MSGYISVELRQAVRAYFQECCAYCRTPASLFHPYQHRWRDHFGWSEEGTMILDKTDIGRVTINALRMNRPELIRLRRMWVRLGEFPPLFEVHE